VSTIASTSRLIWTQVQQPLGAVQYSHNSLPLLSLLLLINSLNSLGGENVRELFVVLATTAADHAVTVALSVLGAIYGVAAISSLIFIVLPRMAARQVAATTAASFTRMIRPARPPPRVMRWSPSYGRGMGRTRPGAYLRRNEIQMQRVTRVSAAPNRDGYQVSLYFISFVFDQQFSCGVNSITSSSATAKIARVTYLVSASLAYRHTAAQCAYMQNYMPISKN